MSGPRAVNARKDHIKIQSSLKPASFAEAVVPELVSLLVGGSSTLNDSPSNFNLGSIEIGVHFSSAMKPVEIDRFYAIKIHDTNVLHAHSRQSLNDQ
jgi:hypothetical protein